MRASLRGREELVTRVQQALALLTKKEAERVVSTVVSCLECTLLNNLGSEWLHDEARQSGQVLCPSQTGDSQEDSVHRQDDPDER
jgi:hypothetical protein